MWKISLLIWMDKAPQQYEYISEKADGKPCLLICLGLQVQIASANFFGTNAITNICKCQRWSFWLIFLLLTLQCLKLYSAVLFKNAFSKHMQMHQIQEFPIVFKFLKNQQPDFRKKASLYYPCIHSWKKNAINNFTLQNW